MKTILAPIDFSAVSDAVVKAAVNLARAINGRLVLLHIVQPPVITSEYGAVLANIQEIVATSEATARRQLLSQKKRLQRNGLKVGIALLTGGPVPLILEQAGKSRATYIVMGSHGHSALYDLLAGSTATGVVKQSPCPVVIVPPAKKKSAK
ncbi:MAG: universal stress protein [Cephaloticoccus sp.]|nr:universal stress protein [Cephaloticoccus sp.]